MACLSSETSKLPLPSYPPVSHTCYFKLFYPCFPTIMHLFSNKSNSYVAHTAMQTPKHSFLLPEPGGLSTPSQQFKQPEVLSCTHNTHVLHHPFSKLSCRLNAALASGYPKEKCFGCPLPGQKEKMVKWFGFCVPKLLRTELLNDPSTVKLQVSQEWNSFLLSSTMTRAWMLSCSISTQTHTPRYCFRFHNCDQISKQPLPVFMQSGTAILYLGYRKYKEHVLLVHAGGCYCHRLYQHMHLIVQSAYDERKEIGNGFMNYFLLLSELMDC